MNAGINHYCATQSINERKCMKALILDGSFKNDRTGERVAAALQSQLSANGWETEHYLLRENQIGNCAGDFFCWVRSPGLCNVDDDNRDIAAAIANSDLLVYLTPITFGGYSSVLKKAVDHQIQNISPFFGVVNGETHHQRRYKQYPDFLAIGWMEGADQNAEMVFRSLVWRNSLNFFAEQVATGIIYSAQADDEIQDSLKGFLEDLKNGSAMQPVELPENRNKSLDPTQIQRALLLVGSPRTRKSTSNSLGGYLCERLDLQGIETETIFIHTSLRNPDRMKNLLAAMERADLVLLAFPLYVDSLPAPVMEALERFALQRDGEPTGQRFAAIANRGFPEADHNAAALAICANFAEKTGFEWAGSLALGAGQGLVHGLPLNQLDGRADSLKRALEIAAEKLGKGLEIPPEAQAYLDKPFVPPWLYRIIGGFGWRQQARNYGVQAQLKRQPYTRQAEVS